MGHATSVRRNGRLRVGRLIATRASDPASPVFLSTSPGTQRRRLVALALGFDSFLHGRQVRALVPWYPLSTRPAGVLRENPIFLTISRPTSLAVGETKGRRRFEQVAKLLLHAMESESHLLGCQAQGVCDLGTGSAVEQALSEHLEIDLRDLRGEFAEHTLHLGLPRETLAGGDRPGAGVLESRPVLDQARGEASVAPEHVQRPVPSHGDQPGREAAAPRIVGEIRKVGDDLAPDLLEAILAVGLRQTLSAEKPPDPRCVEVVEVIPCLGERGRRIDVPGTTPQIGLELVAQSDVPIRRRCRMRPQTTRFTGRVSGSFTLCHWGLPPLQELVGMRPRG